jgi:membrane fusion protein, copper/silver efflux system
MKWIKKLAMPRMLTAAITLLLLVAAFAIGYWVGSTPLTDDGQGTQQAAGESQQWVCSMNYTHHPADTSDHFRKCKFCGMDLIKADAVAAGPRTFAVSAEAYALMDIQTARVERRFVESELRMVGKVRYDETRVKTLTSWVPGRLDRLFVDYTGVPVRKGDHMVELYSPELVATQEELLVAVRTVEKLRDSDSEFTKRTAQRTVDAAREKLRLLGLLPDQIKEIEAKGSASDTLTIRAPMGGIVIEKQARQGMYVKTGTPIYTIADLSQVWVKLDAYEADLAWLRYGHPVTLTTEAYPGELFKGTIAFIDPILNERTRTVKVRVNVPNPKGKLKPNMFVRATVRASVAEGGRVMASSLAGKYVCPMHPEEIKDSKGTCGICGMDLVSTESLGYVAAKEGEDAKPLVIPASAPLITGKRAIVYVQEPKSSQPTFTGYEIVLGPRAGDYYIVKSGLKEGDIVVTNGNFKIDSALQLQAKKSMMSPDGAASGSHAKAPEPQVMPEEFVAPFAAFVKDYMALKDAMVGESLEDVHQRAADLRGKLPSTDVSSWTKQTPAISKALDALAKAEDMDTVHRQFSRLSNGLIAVLTAYGSPTGTPLHRIHCPMVLDNKGAFWISATKEVHNPYSPKMMPKCGFHKETYPPVGDTTHE